MKDLYYENQGTTTYLVYKIKENDQIDTMTLGMLTNNKIPGLVPTTFTQMDKDKYIKFNVSAKVSASQFLSGTVKRKQLLGMFRGITEAMAAAEDYMLDKNDILLNADYIFADVSTCESLLICLPVKASDGGSPLAEMAEKKEDPVEFLRNIMFTTRFDQTEDCGYVAGIMNYLNTTSVPNMRDMKQMLDGLDRQATGTPPTPVQGQMIAQPGGQSYSQPMQQPAGQPFDPAQPFEQVQAFGQAQVYGQNRSAAQDMAAVGNVVPMPAGKPVQNPAGTVSPKKAKSTAKKAEKSNQEKQTENSADNAPEMSFMYLMQHYSKENKAIYDAQKEAKKQKSDKKSTKSKEKSVSKAGKKPQANANVGFVVPGMDGTAVPPVQPAVPQSKSQAQAIPPQQSKAQKSTASPVQPVVQPQPVMQVPPMQSQLQPTAMQVPPMQSQPQPQQPMMQASPMQPQQPAMSETTVLVSPMIGETTVLVNGQLPGQNQMIPFLIRRKGNEKISLNKPVFRIGKERSYADYFIGDNTAISRSHANIVSRDGEYYLVDTNSTNHTFLNGQMIQSNVETKLAHGDTIRLANEDFEFKLY